MKNFREATFCFLGRSGSGKDTQAQLLKQYLEKYDEQAVIVSTGDKGRELTKTDTIVGRHIKKILDRGGLFSDWLAISLWMDVLQEKKLSRETIIFPSSPRYLREAQALDELMSGNNRPSAIPIYIDIDNQEAMRRLLGRGRGDDTREVIAERLSWFERQVLPIIKYYGKRVIKIDGKNSVEDIHKKIVKALGYDEFKDIKRN